MSALPVEPVPNPIWDDLVRFRDESDWPEGSKVEIIEGIITVTPPPATSRNRIAAKIQRMLYGVLPPDWEVYQTLGVTDPQRGGVYVPDLVVMADEVLQGLQKRESALLTDAELVVEITSPSNARQDRTKKVTAYAQAGVPLYLLVDGYARGRQRVRLFGRPRGGLYQTLAEGKFGDPIHLPEPFDLTLDTSGFPTD